MMSSLKKTVLALVLFLCLGAPCVFSVDVESEPEIRIQLATAPSMHPIYASKFQLDDAFFSRQYFEELDSVLLFDLNHNGKTSTVPRSVEIDLLLENQEPKICFCPNDWKNKGADHVIKASVKEKTLSFSVFTPSTGSVKHFNSFELTGNLKQDRRQIHLFCDSLLKALYNIDGVASTKILYSAQVKGGQNEKNLWVSEIYECDWDGGNKRQITKEGSYCVTPVFIPSKKDRFLYVSYKQGQPKIYIASMQQGKGERLIELRGNQLLPAVSAHKDKIAFICDAAGRSDLFVQSLQSSSTSSSKPVQLYSYPRSTQASPTFSPDGEKIAFVSDKDGSPRIYVIPAHQGQKRATPALITKQNQESSCPSWSPDGTKLAYSAKTNGIRQIWIYDFETKQESQLTRGPGHKENPCWAKDSLHLVFNSTDASVSELYIVNLNQPEAIKISTGPGKKHYPSWEH